MLDFVDFLTTKVNNLIKQGARSRMSDKEFLEREIARWKNSPQRLLQIKDIYTMKVNMIFWPGKEP